MGFFSTNWRTQVNKLLPPEMRSNSLVDWITSLINPIQTVMDNNLFWESDIRKRARFNSQKLVLQAALSYIFSMSIIVETGTSPAYNNFVYNESEGINQFSFNETESNLPIYTFNDTEVVDAYDFTVKIPIASYTTELERRVKAEVTRYKLGGKTFNVVTY